MIRLKYLMMAGVCYFVFMFIFTTTVGNIQSKGILYPQDSETRQRISLDGLWNFIQSNSSQPLDTNTDFLYKVRFQDSNRTVQLMPVPASYNDITTNWTLRDHVGVVWYERFFRLPKSFADQRIWIRFGSVSYAAKVWINGLEILSHQIGHLPFQAEIGTDLNPLKEHRITVACDNTLTGDTVPQGGAKVLDSGRTVQTYTFDFFNYAGIDRSVYLYTTPKIFIDDIIVTTESIDEDKAVLNYSVIVSKEDVENVSYGISLIDKSGITVAASSCDQGRGQLTVQNPMLWWPYLMHENPGYQYTFEVRLSTKDNDELIDIYRLPIGIRKLTWSDKHFHINDKPIYLHGFGRHEDSDIRGKGLDLPLIIRDYNLIKWVGANAYRTSHYPYAEEIMDLADSLGIMIIDECPGVNIEKFSDSLLTNHKNSLSELIKRDKNRPSVVMWSAANEPRTNDAAAAKYFEAVIAHIKELDSTRPTTIVESQGSSVTSSSNFVDIVSFNRYNGWYHNEGNLDMVTPNVIKEAVDWHNKFKKLVIMQEYGADTLEGLHFLPDYIWSEEYQIQIMSKHFQAFDQLRSEGYFIGEFIWNFADFKTAQGYTRVGGNKKGIFTRNRQPKASAHFLRKRYWTLAQELYNATLPSDTFLYVNSNYQGKECRRNEL